MPQASLINTAPGAIVNDDDLYDVLSQGRIAGAALDVSVREPLREPSRLGRLENVLLAPHVIGSAHVIFRDIGTAACNGMGGLAHGRPPVRGIINPEVLEAPAFQAKWKQRQVSGAG